MLFKKNTLKEKITYKGDEYQIEYGVAFAKIAKKSAVNGEFQNFATFDARAFDWEKNGYLPRSIRTKVEDYYIESTYLGLNKPK